MFKFHARSPVHSQNALRRRELFPKCARNKIAALTFAAIATICWQTLCLPSLHANSEGPDSNRPRPDQRPNIVLILADDLGYADLASFGSTDMQTPSLDALVERGMKFDNFYANCPVCSPTRAALLSGCYQERVGVPGVIRTHPENSWGNLADDATLLPAVLSKVGYETAIIGKWHLGLEQNDWPTRKGLGYFKGFLGDMMDDYYDHLRHGNNYMREGEVEIDPAGHATDLFSDWSCQFLKQHAEQTDPQPFFLYLAYNAPHTPIQPPQDWLEKTKNRYPGMSDRRAKLVALIEHMDDGIGRVLKTLEETGLAKNTMVIFTSDNGGQVNVGANNGPLRDGKGTMYEGGLKVPAIVAWPGKIEAGSVSNQMAITMDIFKTVCDAAGADSTTAVDSVSFMSALLDEANVSPAAPRDLFFIRREGGLAYNGMAIRAMRRGDWKLVQNSPHAPWELFNLKKDPLEAEDLSKRNRKVYRDLCVEMRKQIQIGGTVKWQ